MILYELRTTCYIFNDLLLFVYVLQNPNAKRIFYTLRSKDLPHIEFALNNRAVWAMMTIEYNCERRYQGNENIEDKFVQFDDGPMTLHGHHKQFRVSRQGQAVHMRHKYIFTIHPYNTCGGPSMESKFTPTE